GHDDGLPDAARLELSREPVAARGTETQRERLAVDEHETHGRACPPHRDHPVAQGDAPDAQALLLGGELLLFEVELVLQPALEVGEQVIPAHAATLTGTRHTASQFSTGCRDI